MKDLDEELTSEQISVSAPTTLPPPKSRKSYLVIALIAILAIAVLVKVFA